MINNTWIIIITIQRIEQNQIQDMKKTEFSSHKKTYFTMQAWKAWFLKNKKNSLGTNQTMLSRVAKKKKYESWKMSQFKLKWKYILKCLVEHSIWCVT